MKQLIGVRLLVGFAMAYWALDRGRCRPWCSSSGRAPPAWRELQAEHDHRLEKAAAFVARADQQHSWTMSGDPRGTFGAYPPAAL